MTTTHDPAAIAAPLGDYCHGMEVPGNSRLLFTAGQVGVDPEGNTPDDFASQCHWAFRNLLAVLESAGMGVADLVKVSIYMTSADDSDAFVEIRRSYFGDHRPASTRLLVAALARPEWLIEIEAVAAHTAPSRG